MTHIDTERRKLLLASGTALSVALAGCGGGGGGDDGGGGGGGDVDVEGEYSDAHSYLSDNSANNYNGSGTDMTGESSVTIEVGAGSSGLAFGPAAVLVDAGTEVTWEWTGEGGGHNVALQEGPGDTFSSETVSEEGHTYSQTLDQAGNYLYQCDPHSANGMHGAVIVQE